MLEFIDTKALQPGMVIVRVTKQNGPVKIKKSGLVTSQEMVLGLVEMGIQQVQIDTDQTVEVKANKVKKSPTRKMLESNQLNTKLAEDGMSDPSYRNMFLPSVQEIPSAWQYYAKRYLFVCFIAFGGLGLGWTMANYQILLTVFSSTKNAPVIVTTSKAPSIETQDEKPIVDGVASIETQPILASAKPVRVGQRPAEESSNINIAATPPEEITQLESTPTNDPIAEPTPQISPELLQKFQQAISEVQEDTAETAPEPISSEKDVPRIDQLPAWIMTRLPSMAFSAHMYASEDSERWVRVNGTRMVEGDKIDGLIEIVSIEPQHVILSYSGQSFSMAALTDW